MSQITISGPGLDLSPSPAGAGESRDSIENPNVPITAARLAEILGGEKTGSGQVVTPSTALKVATVYACVRIVANAIARMPLIVFEKTKGGRQRAENHPLYEPLKMRPNDDMSSFSWRVSLMTNLLLTGNGYSEIVRRGDGRPVALVPIESSRVRPYREGGELRYDVAVEGGRAITLLKRDILHVPGLSFDGISGLSVVAHAKRTLGAALASDEFQDHMLGNSLRPSGVLEHPGKIGPAAVTTLRESLERMYAGSKASGRPMILEEGMKWHQTTMSFEDAQFIESAHLRIEDICRWFGVQPHKVMHLLRSTNNNIEAQGLDFLGDTCLPWVESIEQELNWKLFFPEERARYYAEHLTQAIVQLDTDARMKYYKGMRDIAAINGDEIRARENLNNLPDGRGEVYWMPSSMIQALTPDQADRLVEAWIAKGTGPSSTKGPDSGSGQPASSTDGKVAGAT